jgi:dephospho-CoA kinase
MLKTGLTGYIGSGKGTVVRIFELMGIPVYYSDESAKRLMIEDEQLKIAIINALGKESYLNGNLSYGYAYTTATVAYT